MSVTEMWGGEVSFYTRVFLMNLKNVMEIIQQLIFFSPFCWLFSLPLFCSDGAAEPSWKLGERNRRVSLSAVTVFCALQRVSDPQGSVRWDTRSTQHHEDGTATTARAHGGRLCVWAVSFVFVTPRLTLIFYVCRMMRWLCRGRCAQRCFSWRTHWRRSGKSMRCCASNLSRLLLPMSKQVTDGSFDIKSEWDALFVFEPKPSPLTSSYFIQVPLIGRCDTWSARCKLTTNRWRERWWNTSWDLEKRRLSSTR